MGPPIASGVPSSSTVVERLTSTRGLHRFVTGESLAAAPVARHFVTGGNPTYANPTLARTPATTIGGEPVAFRDMDVLGIDIGGSGIKAAPVDIDAGSLTAPRMRIATPVPAAPVDVANVLADLVRHFEWTGPVGCTFPGVIKAGHTLTAANLGEAWLNLDADALFTERTGLPVTLMNDADAAGIAEMQHGAGRGRTDVVIMLTFGTGIGSALFHDGRLVPNTELGHLQLRNKDAESRAAARVRDEKHLSWSQYAKRVDEYLTLVETALWPDLIIVGGGVSAKADKWFHLLHTRAELVPAALANDAGIVGAAMWTQRRNAPA